MSERIELLDHGYLELIEGWGSDESIVSAARMSTNKGFLGWGPLHSKECQFDKPGTPKQHVTQVPCCNGVPGDEKLLKFLWDNKHATPFEMAGLTVEVQAPIFVFREWMRHRTQSFNELSARYTPLPDLNYVPSVERLLLGSDGKNKQAGTVKDAAVLNADSAREYRSHLMGMYINQQEMYDWALKLGVPKELARVHLPVGRYSRMRASANLRNWLAFLTLRMDKAAQFEIRQYANALGTIVAEKFPRTWELFIGGSRG